MLTALGALARPGLWEDVARQLQPKPSPAPAATASAMTADEAQLLGLHAPRMVMSFGCSASTNVLHLASSVLTAAGTPTGTICDSPKAQEDLDHSRRCELETPSTDEIMRCQNNWYCEDDNEPQGLKDAALALAGQGRSLLFKAPGNPGAPNYTPAMLSLLQASGTRGVALVRCNKLDKAACDTRSCIEFFKYGHRVDSQGQGTSDCVDSGHAVNGNRKEKEDVRASLDLRPHQAIDNWLEEELRGERSHETTKMLELLQSSGLGTSFECSEDLLAFEAKGGGAEAMSRSIAAWVRFATDVGACESTTNCDANAIRKALKDSGHEGTYEVRDTCDLVYNCNELKETLVRKGTPAVLQMFRPQAELFDLWGNRTNNLMPSPAN